MDGQTGVTMGKIQNIIINVGDLTTKEQLKLWDYLRKYSLKELPSNKNLFCSTISKKERTDKEWIAGYKAWEKSC